MYYICFVHVYPLNCNRELNSFDEPRLTRVATITSFAVEFNPAGAGELILSSTDRLFRWITTLQCGETRGILGTGFETQLTHTPAVDSTKQPLGT